jgi:hypothetical protein
VTTSVAASMATIIGPEKIVIVVNMDSGVEVHLGLEADTKLEKQINVDMLSQFDLSVAERHVLSAALVLVLRGGQRSPEAVVFVTVDHNALLLLRSATESEMQLTAANDDGHRVVWANGKILLTTTVKTRAE